MRAAAASMPGRALGVQLGRQLAGGRSVPAGPAWSGRGSRISGVKAASEDAGVKGGGADAVGQFGRVVGVPDRKVGAQAGGDAAPVGQAKGAGGMGGGAQQRLLRRQAEQGAGHVHRQRQRGHGRGAGVAGRWPPPSARRAARRAAMGGHLRFAQGVEGAGQDHGDGSGGGHRGDAVRRRGIPDDPPTARRGGRRRPRRPRSDSCSACSLTGRPRRAGLGEQAAQICAGEKAMPSQKASTASTSPSAWAARSEGRATSAM